MTRVYGSDCRNSRRFKGKSDVAPARVARADPLSGKEIRARSKLVANNVITRAERFRCRRRRRKGIRNAGFDATIGFVASNSHRAMLSCKVRLRSKLVPLSLFFSILFPSNPSPPSLSLSPVRKSRGCINVRDEAGLLLRPKNGSNFEGKFGRRGKHGRMFRGKTLTRRL